MARTSGRTCPVRVSTPSPVRWVRSAAKSSARSRRCVRARAAAARRGTHRGPGRTTAGRTTGATRPGRWSRRVPASVGADDRWADQAAVVEGLEVFEAVRGVELVDIAASTSGRRRTGRVGEVIGKVCGTTKGHEARNGLGRLLVQCGRDLLAVALRLRPLGTEGCHWCGSSTPAHTGWVGGGGGAGGQSLRVALGSSPKRSRYCWAKRLWWKKPQRMATSVTRTSAGSLRSSSVRTWSSRSRRR